MAMTGRLMRFLEEIPDPQELPFELEVDDEMSSQSRIWSQERPSYSRAPSAQNRVLQPELRSMIQTLQQQLEEQKFQQEQLSADQKAREEKLLAQLEQQREEQKTREAEQKAREAEQKAREEKLLAQLEQQQERLFKLLEQKEMN
jgi:septal ring factor EnvC (AmiA/AmiB activator)